LSTVRLSGSPFPPLSNVEIVVVEPSDHDPAE
jgi:hypothetical protein